MPACREGYGPAKLEARPESIGAGRARSAATSATSVHLRGSAARWLRCSVLSANSEQNGRTERWCVEGPFGLTFEFTRVRKRAKPAVALRVQRRVRPRHCVAELRTGMAALC